MNGQDLLAQLRAAGLTVELAAHDVEGGAVRVSPRHAITDGQRSWLQGLRSELVQVLQVEDRSLSLREAWFAGRGRTDANSLALQLRDRDNDFDDRRLCLECAYLLESGYCGAAAVGRIRGASKALKPTVTVLMRCEAFVLKPGLL